MQTAMSRKWRMHPEDDAEQYKWCETQDGTLTVHSGASCTAGLHKPRFIRRAILPVCLTTSWVRSIWFSGVSLLVTLFASNNAAAIATNEVEPETAPAQNPKLVTAARWKPRRKVVNPVTRRGFASNTNTSDVSMGCARSITRTIRSVALAGTSARTGWCAWMVSAGGVGIGEEVDGRVCLSSALDNIGTYVRN